MSPKRVLFVAEAVTLAHVSRPWVLASHLASSSRDFEVHFASADRYSDLLARAPLRRWDLESLPPDVFRERLRRGEPLYDRRTLEGYVEEETRLLREVRPDLVVGDFRLSLSVSAPLCGVPYAALANATWSPHARRAFPLPEHPAVRLLGAGAAERLFRCARDKI